MDYKHRCAAPSNGRSGATFGSLGRCWRSLSGLRTGRLYRRRRTTTELAYGCKIFSRCVPGDVNPLLGCQSNGCQISRQERGLALFVYLPIDLTLTELELCSETFQECG